MIPFEQALGELETIVTRMESGQLPLEEALVAYTESQRLIQQCQEQLNTAAEKVTLLKQNEAGEYMLQVAEELEQF